jgi:phage protein D
MARANRGRPLVPSFAVKLNGKPLLPEMSMWIVNVVVEEELDLPGMFTLELTSRINGRGTSAWTDDARLSLGAAVEISMGYGEDRESLMIGEIAALEPTFSIGGPSSIIVRGFDLRQRLNTVRRTRSFVDKKDSDIAAQIGVEAGVEIKAPDSRVKHAYVLQADQTDLEFLRDRASRIRHELVAVGKSLQFRPMADASTSTVTLTLRDDLFEFRPRMSFVPLTSVKVLGWDPKEKQTITAAAPSSGAGDRVETLVRTPVASQEEADQIADASFADAGFEFIRGEGRVRGRTDVRAGTVVRFDDLGTRFSGGYYLTSVVHRYSRRDGYLTDFRAQRKAP